MVPAAVVARSLAAPLDIIVARKICHPFSPEFAIGAIAESGPPVGDMAIMAAVGRDLDRQLQNLQQEAAALRARYTGDRPPYPLDGRIAIVVDDGIATGLTMEAAVAEAWRRNAYVVVVAVPVAPETASERLLRLASDVVVLHQAGAEFQAVGRYYEHFDQVGNEEVELMMQKTAGEAPVGILIDLESLNAVLTTIRKYPVTSRAIARQAKTLGAAPSVVSFFESIPGGTSFQDKKDVMNRTYEVEVLAEQEQDEPDDYLRNY
jgi:predicted phosphoribosyltransferase